MKSLVLLPLFFISCQQNRNTFTDYEISEGPKKQVKLTSVLSEVSGFAFYKKNIIMHNDEEAILIQYNPGSGDYISRTEILNYGSILEDDFEGIAAYGSTIYLINSNGVIYRFWKKVI